MLSVLQLKAFELSSTPRNIHTYVEYLNETASKPADMSCQKTKAVITALVATVSNKFESNARWNVGMKQTSPMSQFREQRARQIHVGIAIHLRRSYRYFPILERPDLSDVSFFEKERKSFRIVVKSPCLLEIQRKEVPRAKSHIDRLQRFSRVKENALHNEL